MTAVSVISVFHNRAHGVAATAESLLAQTHANLDIQLVDDGSTDTTLHLMQRYAGDPRVRIVSHHNMGFVAALKHAIASTTSPYIALLGAGDTCHPERLARQAEVLDRHGNVGAVGCGTENVNATNGAVISVKRSKLEQPVSQMVLRSNPFHHGEIMFRRSLYDAVGGYRDFFVFAQDRDLICRFSHRADFHIIEDVLYTRVANAPGSVSASPEKLCLQRRLSDFAVFCHRERLAGRPDPLDTYGPAAALLRDRSPRLAQELRAFGLGALRRGDLAKARKFLQQAHAEGPHLLSLLGLAATSIFARPRTAPSAPLAREIVGADQR